MRSNKYSVARLHDKVTFGHEGKTDQMNPNTGQYITGFQGDVTVHCGSYSISANQTISVAGSTIRDTTAIVIRHNPKLDISTYREAQYKGELYKVSDWVRDDELLAYDVVTLTKKNGHD